MLISDCVDTYSYMSCSMFISVCRAHEIFDTFCLKDSTWALCEQAQLVLRTFLFSKRYSIAKFENRVSQRHGIFSLGNISKLLHSSTFLPDCSLTICEKPSTFAVDVRVSLSCPRGPLTSFSRIS